VQKPVIHENSQVSAGGQEGVGLIIGSARDSFSRISVVPESEMFPPCALPTSLEVTGMCFCMLGNILDAGAEGTVQGGDVGALAPSFRKTWGHLAPSSRRMWWLQAPSGSAGLARGKILFPLLFISH